MPQKIFDYEAQIMRHERVAEAVYALKVHCPEITAAIAPGQFVEISVSDNLSPLLRRPFSVYRILAQEGCLEFRYKVVGEGTRLLSEWPSTKTLKILGPLGRGFTLPAQAKAIAVIGRGMGIAPLGALAEAARAQGTAVVACLSTDTAEKLDSFDLFNCPDFTLYRQSDDGHYADGALVTDPLLREWPRQPVDALYVCGSKRLLNQAHALSQAHGALAEVSLEQHMGCGLGACICCIIETYTDPQQTDVAYKRVCKEGPVFSSWEVALNG